MIAAAKPTRTPVVTLSLDQAAADLNTTALSVKRLVARGRLSATRVGDDWRLLPGTIEKYLSAGAPDLQTVALDGPGWLADWPRPLSDFETAITDAAQQALEADPAALARIAADESEVVEYVAPIGPAILTAAKQQVPGQLSPVVALRERFPTWASLWLAEQLREFARQEIRRVNPVARPAGKLYASPDDYAETVKAAGERLTGQTITRIAWIAVEVDGNPTKRPVRLVVPVAALMTAVGITAPAVATAAF